MQPKDTVTLVTGGNSGIGLGTARRLVEEGAFVYITGRRQEAHDHAVEAIGRNVRAIRAHVTKRTDMTHVAELIRSGHGRLDILLPMPAAAASSPWRRSPRRTSTST